MYLVFDFQGLRSEVSEVQAEEMHNAKAICWDRAGVQGVIKSTVLLGAMWHTEP